MIYQAHIERVGPHVADGLADNLLITFRADGPADCTGLRPGPAARFSARACPTTSGRSIHARGELPHHRRWQPRLQALLELGHLTLVFDSASTPRHQGATSWAKSLRLRCCRAI
jgi:PTS system glucitol/sorbitol-specific IIA component